MAALAGRRLWFQVHKWLGIVLAILIIPLSLSGAALVWHDALDRAINPARYAVSGRAGTLPPSAYAAAARAALPPGLRLASLALPGAAGDPVIVSAAAPDMPGARVRPGPPRRTNVYLDPADGHVLAVASSAGGLMRTIHMLHGNLLLPGVGRQVVGWIGVAMLISSLSGLWLWWPSIGGLARGLRWRRQPAFDGNLHHQIGFWIALPLAVLSLTGAWIAFPAFFGVFSGGAAQQPRGGGEDRMRLMRATPVAAPALAPEAVLARALPLGHGSPATILWPTDASPAWRIGFASAAGQPPGEVLVDDTTGVATPGRGGGAGNQASLARLMRRLHDGTGMGPVWQTIIFAGGIAPAVLAVTGILMWLRTRRWRSDAGRRGVRATMPAE